MRIAVVGLGLIGGSIALAARERLGAEVRGWDLNPASASRARSLGVVDSATRSIEEALEGSEAAFVAAPVDVLPELVGAVLARASGDCLVTDVGSTKRSVVGAIDDSRFVGGHPLAGAELSGVEHARADLFAGATWYLTPGSSTAPATVRGVAQLVTELGATAKQLDAEVHDRLMAAVSHLPHVFANVLLSHALESGVTDATGPSFRDATRVAGANPALWSAIFEENRDELIAAINDAIERLEDFRDRLRRQDRAAVRQWCEEAADNHRRLGR